MRAGIITTRRYATLSAAYARDAVLWLLVALPWLVGLVVGLVVALALWWVVAAMDGYRTGRGHDAQ